jgi:hypothetical protein
MIEFDEPGVKRPPSPLHVVLEASVADTSCGVALRTIIVLNCSSRLPLAQRERKGRACSGRGRRGSESKKGERDVK